MRIFVLFNLKPGVEEAVYLAWAKSTRGAVAGDIAPAHGVGTASDVPGMCGELRSEGATVDYVLGDLLDDASISAVVQTTVERFGRIDIFVNNAGIGYLFGPLIEMTKAHLDAVRGVNLRAVILATRDAAAFLCSEAASYVTAESLNVSGGEEYH